jgi:hypothetical protein
MLLSACGMQWAGFNADLGTLGSRDATRLSTSMTEKNKVLAEISQDNDIARLNAALVDVLAQADQRGSEQRTQWADFIPSMTFEQKLHVLDVLANERLSVLASDADAPRQ